MSNTDYDVIVVGSGFGGSVTALRLTEKGYRVGVLEAGRRFTDDQFPKTSWDVRKFVWAPKLGCFGIQRIHMLRDVVILQQVTYRILDRRISVDGIAVACGRPLMGTFGANQQITVGIAIGTGALRAGWQLAHGNSSTEWESATLYAVDRDDDQTQAKTCHFIDLLRGKVPADPYSDPPSPLSRYSLFSVPPASKDLRPCVSSSLLYSAA